MNKIFVRERRHAGRGAGRPRFAIVAMLGTELKILAPHLRKSELEALASATQSEIVYLPRGEQANQSEQQSEKGRRRGWKHNQE